MRSPSRTDLRNADAAMLGNLATATDREPEQLSLLPDRGEQEWWNAVLGEVRRIVAIRGLKQVAFDLDIQPSRLAHALAERDRKGIRGRWIGYFIEHAPDARLAGLFASRGRFDVVPKIELTPEEQLSKLLRVLEKSGPAGAAVLAEAGLR